MTAQSFAWSGIDKQGKRVSGVVTGQDMKEAKLELQKKQVEVINISQKKTITFSFGKPKIKPADILLFTRYLSTMLVAGLPILQALDLISKDQKNPTMQSFILNLKNNTSSGKTLAETFIEYPQYFSSLYCNLIKAGEKSGTLDKILIRLTNYLERSEALKRKVKKAMIYPAAVVTVAVGVCLVLLLFVVPQFQHIFESFGAKLPAFTQMVIGISNGLREYWWIALGVVGAAVYTLRYLIKYSKKFQRMMDVASLRIIIIGPMLRKSIVARFARTLSITMDAGMPIIESMRSMADIMGNGIYKDAINHICDDVVSGHSLSDSMKSTNLFANMVVQMVGIGEASGSLSAMLSKIADYYEDDVNTIVDGLSTLLEPLIMAILGVIVGGFVVAMYLPIFKMGSLF